MFTGIRDCLLNVEVEVKIEDFADSSSSSDDRREFHVCEIQLHLAPILALKGESHQYYEFFRDAFAGNDESYKARLNVFNTVSSELGDIGEGASLEERLREIIFKSELPQTSDKVTGLAGWWFGVGTDMIRLDFVSQLCTMCGDYDTSLIAMSNYGRGLLASTNRKHSEPLMTCLRNLTIIYHKMGQNGRAAAVYRVIIKTLTRLYGEEYGLVSECMLELCDQDIEFEEKVETLEKCLALQVQKFPDSPLEKVALKCLLKLANLYICVGDVENYRKVMQERLIDVGAKYPKFQLYSSFGHVAKVVMQIQMNRWNENRDGESSGLDSSDERLIKALLRGLSDDMTRQLWLSKLCVWQHDYSGAAEHYEEVVRHNEKIKGKSGFDTLWEVCHLGSLHLKRRGSNGDDASRHVRTAMDCYERSLDGCEGSKSSVLSVVSHTGLGRCYEALKDYERAVESYEKGCRDLDELESNSAVYKNRIARETEGTMASVKNVIIDQHLIILDSLDNLDEVRIEEVRDDLERVRGLV
jgi:tetratricopeptide (TPR) repeat protein